MPTEPRPVSVYDVVHRAVSAVDGTGADADTGRLLERFEDADEPIGAPEPVRDRIAAVVEKLDPVGMDGALRSAGMVATYLAFRRDEVDSADSRELMRLAARAEHDGHPPAAIAQFLAQAGVEL